MSELLWFLSSPQELVFPDRETEKKGTTFSLHQATLMPLIRREQGTCLRVEKEEGKWKPARSHPPRLTGPVPGSLQLSLREGPAFALSTTAEATSNSAENGSQRQWVLIPSLSNTWLLNAPFPCVNLAGECGTEDLKSWVMGEG